MRRAAIELTPDDLRDIDSAVSKITVEGAWYPEHLHKFNETLAIPADSFVRAVAFAMGLPEELGVNEILFRPTRQEL